MKQEIIETVKFGKKTIFQMSPTTWLLDIERSSMANAKNLFARYLGPNCYDIIEFNGYLMLLICGKISDHHDLRTEILDMRKKAIEINKSSRTKNKTTL